MSSGKRSRRKGGVVTALEIERKEKKRQAIELRKAGATYEHIAERLDIATGTAYNYVREALYEMVSEPADELRRIHYERLNNLLVTLWPRAVKGDMPAMDRTLGIMDRIAKLAGIDAPTAYADAGGEVIIIDGSKADYIKNLKALRARNMAGDAAIEEALALEAREQDPGGGDGEEVVVVAGDESVDGGGE